MKKLRKSLLVMISALFVLALGLVAAACNSNAKKVTLSFETNGGSAAESIVAEPGTTAELPATARDGFVFDGWYLAADFSGEACGGTVTVPEKNTTYYAKWATGYEVKLELDGGTTATGTTSLWLKEGANVYDAVQGVQPTKAGLTFGAWFVGDDELSRTLTMPAETVTLTAKYKVGYVVQIYLANVEIGYQRHDELEVSGSDYVGKTLTVEEPQIANFVPNDAPEGAAPSLTRTLSENTSSNVFRVYYDRQHYQLSYLPNLPADVTVTGTMEAQDLVYQAYASAAACGFTAEGYRFAGWSTAPDDEVEYREAEAVQVLANTTLYAVWDKGLEDRFGSTDYIFYPRFEPDKVILYRGGHEFEGTVGENDTFSFTTPSKRTFSGKRFGDTFVLEREDLVGTYTYYYNYYDPELSTEERFDSAHTLEIDGFLGATYTKDGVKVEGSLDYDVDRGDYLFRSNDGTKEFYCSFQERDMGTGLRKIFALSGDEFGYYVNSYGETLVLDGYGGAFMIISDGTGYQQSVDGYYSVEPKITLWDRFETYRTYCLMNDQAGLIDGNVGIKEFNLLMVPNYFKVLGEEEYEQYGYCFFSDTSRGTYTVSDGSKLVLDGHGYFDDSAVYTDANGNVVQKGPYAVESGYVKGNIVSILKPNANSVEFTAADVVAKFRIDLEEQTFAAYTDPEEVSTEYYFVEGSTMHPVLMAMYEGKDGSLRVEFHANDSNGHAQYAGAGTVEKVSLMDGYDFTAYRFTRTAVVSGYEQTIPATMIFTTDVVESNGYYYDAYTMLEREGVKLYKTVELKTATGNNDGVVWASTSVTDVDGVGSLYFAPGGKVYRCSFPDENDPFFGVHFGELRYRDDLGTGLTRLYTLSDSTTTEDGWVATVAASYPTSIEYYYPGYSALYGTYTVLAVEGDLARDSEGRAKFDDFGADRDPTDTNYVNVWDTDATWRRTDERTLLGDVVYSLVIGGQEKFKFTYTEFNYFGTPYPMLLVYIGKEGVYTAADGSTLTLDGYGRARYSGGASADVVGNYYFYDVSAQRGGDTSGDPTAGGTVFDGTSPFSGALQSEGFRDVKFMFGEGDDYNERSFELSSETAFVALDYAVGVWDLVNSNFLPYNAKITFNGKGQYTIRAYSGGFPQTGSYEVVDPTYPEYVLYGVNFGGLRGNYNVRFMEYAEYNNFNCVVRFKSTGVFIDDDFNVLHINGFGAGNIYGEIAGNINVNFIDEELNFGYFIVMDEISSYYDQLFHFRLDVENGTFSLVEQEAQFYVAADLDPFLLREDNAAFVGSRSGDYLIDGDTLYLYLQTSGGTYERQELPAPTGNVYAYKANADAAEKKYYKWNGEEFAFDGTVDILDHVDKDGDGKNDTEEKQRPVFGKDGKQETDEEGNLKFETYEEEILEKTAEVAATIRFQPQIRGFYTVPVSFDIGGVNYKDFVLNVYTSGKADPRITWESINYQHVEFSYDEATGKRSFHVTDAGYRLIERTDYLLRYFNEGGTDKANDGMYRSRGAEFAETYFGFGGYQHDPNRKPTAKVYVNYLYDPVAGSPTYRTEPITGEVELDSKRLIGYVNISGTYVNGTQPLYELLFEDGGVQYAIDYILYDYESIGYYNSHFYLHAFYRYEELDAGDDYKVGVKYMQYVGMKGIAGYEDETLRDVATSITLIRKDAQGTVVPSLEVGMRFLKDTNGLYLIEYDSSKTNNAGTAYLVTFTLGADGKAVTAATVTENDLIVVGYSTGFAFYVFTQGSETNPDVVEIVSAIRAGRRFASVRDLVENADGTWSFYGKEASDSVEQKYTVRIGVVQMEGVTRFTVNVTVESIPQSEQSPAEA